MGRKLGLGTCFGRPAWPNHRRLVACPQREARLGALLLRSRGAPWPRAHRTLAPRTAIVRPCLLLGRRNHPHTPPRPASHPASHPGASCTIRGRPHAPRRSRADLNPAPTASPLMRSFMAHARLAHGRGSVDVLCLSAHLTGIPPQSHRSLTARQPTIAPASRAPPYTDLPTDPPPPALVAQADCMRRSRDPPGDQP